MLAINNRSFFVFLIVCQLYQIFSLAISFLIIVQLMSDRVSDLLPYPNIREGLENYQRYIAIVLNCINILTCIAILFWIATLSIIYCRLFSRGLTIYQQKLIDSRNKTLKRKVRSSRSQIEPKKSQNEVSNDEKKIDRILNLESRNNASENPHPKKIRRIEAGPSNSLSRNSLQSSQREIEKLSLESPKENLDSSKTDLLIKSSDRTANPTTDKDQWS